MDVIAYGLAKAKAKAYTDTAIAALPKGLKYKGAVDYQASLPASPSVGDCYTVKYKGTSGTEAWGAEFVWGKYEGTDQWIRLGSDADANPVKKSSITIPVASWTGSAPLFSQVITVTGATANTKVDIQPDSASIDLIKANGCTALYTVNDNGTVTAYAKDSTPSADITVQITLTEVAV